MAQKTYTDPDIGEFTVTKKRNARRITLRIAANGNPNVSIPAYAPYATGVSFIRANREWVEEHAKPFEPFLPGSTYELYDGTILEITESESRNSTRKSLGALEVRRVAGSNGMKYVQKALTEHLKADSKAAVAPRVQLFADRLGVSPAAIRYKATTSRWGSCNHRRELTFSVYIAQLPNELIDYIVIHELSHIREMNHSADFWAIVASEDPHYKENRKALKEFPLEPHLKKQ